MSLALPAQLQLEHDERMVELREKQKRDAEFEKRRQEELEAIRKAKEPKFDKNGVKQSNTWRVERCVCRRRGRGV